MGKEKGKKEVDDCFLERAAKQGEEEHGEIGHQNMDLLFHILYHILCHILKFSVKLILSVGDVITLDSLYHM